jgi:CheY-like chemotaxis protein
MSSDPVFVYVEDDPLSREVLFLTLREGMGYEQVTVFEDGAQFLAALPQMQPAPNFFLFDIHMAPYDGFELLARLHQEPGYEGARVVALTASVMNEEIVKLKQAGFWGVIPKPIDPIRFPVLLQKILAGEAVWTVK